MASRPAQAGRRRAVLSAKPLGPYIVDFFAPAAGLVVEADGSQHFTAEGLAADTVRDAALARLGLRVLRFDDRQVLLEMDAVLEEIWPAVVGRE